MILLARLQRAYSISMVTETSEDIRILQVQGQKKEDLSVALQKGHKSCLFYDDTPQICCSLFLSCNQLYWLFVLSDTWWFFICAQFETIIFITTQFMPWCGKKVFGKHISKTTYLSALVFEFRSIMPKVMYQILVSWMLMSWLTWPININIKELITRNCREWTTNVTLS